MSVDVLADQLKFMNLGADAQKNIQAVKTIITQELPGALDTFYAQVRRFPETVKFFSNEAQIVSAKSRQLAHWDAISGGRFDVDYVKAASAVGDIHAKIGLEPRCTSAATLS